MFKHGVTIGPSGSVRPCCMYDNIDMPWYYNDTGWQEEFDRLYEESLSDEWNPKCHECKAEEEEHGYSLRMEANEMFGDDSAGTQYWDLKINNTCNLMCRMCSPNNSSTWKTKVQESGSDEWVSFVQREMKMRTGWHKDILPKMIHNLYDTKVLKFTGGEPMLIPHVKRIIEWCVQEDLAPGIEIRLTTNCTVDPDDWWIENLAKFAKVRISLSLDGLGDRFNYIRAGADWSSVEQYALKFAAMFKKHDNWVTNVSFLPMCLNAQVEHDMRAWCKQHNIHFHRSPEIWRPDYLSYASLDYSLRERYNVSSNKTFDPAMLAKLKQQMALIDKLYGTDFKTQCPEFFE